MYSLLIELYNEKEKKHFPVFNENNLTVEECVKQALKWRVRPYQKLIKKLYIFIEPLLKEPSANNSYCSSSSGSSNYSNLTTQSTLLTTSQVLKDEDTEFQSGIKKKITFACYGKFVSFLKSYCIKNDKGSFRIVFIIDDTPKNFFEQLISYQKRMKKKLLSYNIGINELTEENKLSCETIIGLGAFGVVYKSPLPKLQRTLKKSIDTCAIKVIPLITISNVSSVYREIYILNLMSLYDKLSPYVVNYYGSFIDNEYLYIVMEYLQGPSLNHFITTGSEKYSQQDTKNKKEHVNEIVSISQHLAKGLQSIHDVGIVHRDLKPGNIMFDGSNNFKIVDFGFAALVPKTNIDEILKWDNKVVGTYRFSPPEVLSFAPDINWLTADYWSMGTVIYFVATGRQFLDRSSKDRIEMLNILHKRIDTTKPLKIQFFNVFSSGEKSIQNKSKIKSASAPAVSCNNNLMSIIKSKTSCDLNHIAKSKDQLEMLIRGLLEYLPDNRIITSF
jgi:hypothetical protein